MWILATLVVALTAPAPGTEPVAVIGASRVTASELSEAVGNRLISLETQEYEIRERLLEELIDRRLLEEEARGQGVSKAQLEELEVDSKVAPATDDEIARVRSENEAQLAGVPDREAVEEVRRTIDERRKSERRKVFLKELRRKAGVHVLLEPPRVDLPDAEGPAMGPEGAPVTIVEFSDFECPFCASAAALLRQIHDVFGSKVRIVFRDYPLEAHKNASKAAEAGACAGDQGRFWAMHDALFSDQVHLGVPDLKSKAKALGLDPQAFEQCLDSGRRADSWKAGVEAGDRYGVSGTPFFFVNGRAISGDVSPAIMEKVVLEELERKGETPPPPRGAERGHGPSN
jgi:predicted DsbA family dithiol-disulfide isomerase